MKHALSAAGLAVLLVSSAVCQTQVPLPGHSSVYNGLSRGYKFTAATNFIIAQLDLPPDAFQAGDEAGYLVRVNGVNVLHSTGNAGGISTSLLVNPGDVVDVIGNWSNVPPTSSGAHNSYSASATSHPTTIEGVPHSLVRAGWQNNVNDPALPGSYLNATSGQIGRVFIYTTPQNGLFANFTSDVQSGPVGQTVNFTDTTFTSDPAGVQTWDWDLDGDGTSDSTLENPSFMYNACGAFDVTLTVTDTQNPASTITKTGYIEIGITPITPSFTWAPLGGDTYQFTDTSTPTPASWDWDFDGDGTTDSTMQNPVHTYPACTANANVTLNVSNTCSGPYSTTDSLLLLPPITPSFTYAQIAPGMFQFTDTSTPTPTSWAWDLDGDATIDSLMQNPVYTFPSGCPAANVTLYVGSPCAGPWSVSEVIIAAPNAFTTTLAPNNGAGNTPTGGNLFNIDVTNPTGVAICALTLTPYTTSQGTPLTCDVWVTDAAGGYMGNNTNAAVWRLVATGVGTDTGVSGGATPFALSNNVYLPAGSYGMAITTSQSLRYRTEPSNPTVYTGPDFTISTGIGTSALFGTVANQPRGICATFHYSVRNNGDLAGYGFFGSGCAGSMGISNLANDVAPSLGATMSVTANNLPVDAGVMMTGFSYTNSVFGPLPYDVSGFGAPGCFLRVSPDANQLLLGTPSSNMATWTFGIPNDPTLTGLRLYNQMIVIDPGYNAASAVASDAHAGFVGL